MMLLTAITQPRTPSRVLANNQYKSMLHPHTLHTRYRLQGTGGHHVEIVMGLRAIQQVVEIGKCFRRNFAWR
jgi:hypothetical protein